jgi:HlyD family secretion protein
MKNNLRPWLAVFVTLCVIAAARASSVSAIGRVLPSSGVFDVAGPQGETIEAILVKEGDWVDAGAPLARLSSTAANTQRVRQAEAELTAAQKQVTSDLALAKQLLKAAEEDAGIAEARLNRIRSAKDSEFISPDTVEARTMAHSAAQSKVAQAQQDVMKAEREGRKAVQAAETELRLARSALAASQMQSPARARVLKILARPGAATGRQEIFKLGDTSSMQVVAEVYESDILKIKAGQKATISSVALGQPMNGVVESVGRMVYRNTLQSMDPSAQVYARVVEVVIRMEATEPLDRLVYLQVDVKITL